MCNTLQRKKLTMKMPTKHKRKKLRKQKQNIEKNNNKTDFYEGYHFWRGMKKDANSNVSCLT